MNELNHVTYNEKGEAMVGEGAFAASPVIWLVRSTASTTPSVQKNMTVSSTTPAARHPTERVHEQNEG